MDKKIAVVVPVLYNFKGVCELFKSIDTKYVWEPIIVDNWNDNRGVAKSWNEGINNARERGFTHVLVSNDDVVLSPKAIDVLVDMIDEQGYMLVTPSDMKDIVSEEDLKYREAKDMGAFSGPDFACFMVPVDIFDHVGTFDENFYPAYFEDNDFCHRMVRLKLPIVRGNGVFMIHKGSQTQFFHGRENKVVSDEKFRRNAEYYVGKWGGPIGLEKFIHPYNRPDLTCKDWFFMPRPA